MGAASDAFGFQKEMKMALLPQFWCFVLFDGEVSFGKA